MLSPKNPDDNRIKTDTIAQDPVLDPSQDYYFLRRKGIEFIEQMASAEWTDYNSHDPGITILEALCYALTELGYRIGMDIKDILAEPAHVNKKPERQAFFSAQEILTVNPLTIDDYRRLLIDMDNVANAWLIAKNCPCEVQLYADCKQDRLGYRQPISQDREIKVAALGMYDILVDLDHDPILGDLNDSKVKDSHILKVKDKNHTLATEFRFPVWDTANWQGAGQYFDIASGKLLLRIEKLEYSFSLFKSDESGPITQEEEERRWQQWQRVFFARFKMTFTDSDNAEVGIIELKDVPFKLFGSKLLSQSMKLDWDLLASDKWVGINPGFFVNLMETYIKKAATAEHVLAEVWRKLHEHRNLCEDFCNLSLICNEDVAVCADIDIKPDADIELVLANVLFAIERYFNPTLKFYSLQELMAEEMPVDEIFDGPKLRHGFIKQSDLTAAQLKTQLRTSDIINALTHIDGVLAVKNLLLTRYDAHGQPVAGVADGNATGGRNKLKTSASWTLDISERCQPKLYVDNSKFTFFKNGLPFIPRASEVQDTLNELRGQDERIKIRHLTESELDLPIPSGVYRPLGDFHPVQYTLPMTYGVRFEGLRKPASEKRQAQARQLKAYLLVFEQILANAFAQIANVKNLFSLDPNQIRTYFHQYLRDDKYIQGITELTKPALTDDSMRLMVETEAENGDRRNRVLDHLMSRFAESFAEYTMTLHSLDSSLKAISPEALVKQKIAFLSQYPLISRERNRGMDYLQAPTANNHAVLRKRIALLLGMGTAQERTILVVEHLLLRPKFPGDALLEICLDQHCNDCNSAADPYSFQLTIIMPGWIEPFLSDIELRRFADRSIRYEIPAHLLGKSCWLDNKTYNPSRDDNLVDDLRDLIRSKGKTARGASPTEASATQGARKLFAKAKTAFVEWIVKMANLKQADSKIAEDFKSHLRAVIPQIDALYGGVKNYDEIGAELYGLLESYFIEMTLSGELLRYNRFKTAWEDWLVANQGFRWQNEKRIRESRKFPNVTRLAADLSRNR